MPLNQSQNSQILPSRSPALKAKQNVTTALDDPKTKGAKGKKVTEPKIETQQSSIEPIMEQPIVEEVFLNSPPAPPKPKTILPPLDLSNFVK